MEFTAPDSTDFHYTIYGKTDCTYCVKVKELLTSFNEQYTYINCDEYLLNDKEAFLKYIKELAGKEHKTFPIVFRDMKLIGGYTDTYKLLLEEHE
jgi:glutaredoxin